MAMKNVRGNEIESESNRIRIKLTERCIRNYLPNEINSVPDHILARIYTHRIQGFSSCLKTYKLINMKSNATERTAMFVSNICKINVCPCLVRFLYLCIISLFFFSLFFYTVGIPFFFFFFVFYICSCSYIITIYFVLLICLKLTFQFCRFHW